jgi:hypothetical protein
MNSVKSKHIYRNEDEERKKVAKLMWNNGLRDVKAIGTNAELLMKVLGVNLGVAIKLTNHTQGVSFLYRAPSLRSSCAFVPVCPVPCAALCPACAPRPLVFPVADLAARALRLCVFALCCSSCPPCAAGDF